MKRTRAQKRAELRAMAEGLIEEMLDWDEETAEPTLTVIEEKVLRVRERFGQRLAEVVIEGQEAVQPVAGPTCGECGERMRYKGRKRVTPESRLGELRIARGY
jgi:hypothetical protein